MLFEFHVIGLELQTFIEGEQLLYAVGTGGMEQDITREAQEELFVHTN